MSDELERPIETVGDLIAVLQQVDPAMQVVGSYDGGGAIEEIAGAHVLPDGSAVCVEVDAYGAYDVRKKWRAAQETEVG